MDRRFGDWFSREVEFSSNQRRWDRFVRGTREHIQKTLDNERNLPSFTGETGWIEAAVLARGSLAFPALSEMRETVERCIRYFLATQKCYPIECMWLLELANGLEIVGVDVDTDALLDRVGRLAPLKWSPDDLPDTRFALGLFGIAYALPALWQSAAGLGYEPDATFEPGRTFAFNLPALVGYLGRATESGATLAAVYPAWRDFLLGFVDLRKAEFVSPSHLLPLARVVAHEIGGVPLAETGTWLHRDLCDYAGIEPYAPASE